MATAEVTTERPGSPEEAAKLLRSLGEAGKGVRPRGGGTKLPDVLERLDQLSEEYGMRVANVFHAGDGNLHPLVCYDGRVEGEAEKAEELSAVSYTHLTLPTIYSV